MQFRRCFLGLVAILTSTLTHAQFKQGDKMAGASIASVLYNSGSSNVSFPNPQTAGYTGKNSSYSLRVEPTLGWFISEKTAVGAGINISATGQKSRYMSQGTAFQEDKVANFNFGGGLFVRNYFGSGSSFMPFGQFGFNLGFSSGKTEGFRYFSGTPGSKQTYDGDGSAGFFFNTALQLGMTKMMGENVGLDVYLGYNFSRSASTFKTTTLTDLNLDGTIDTRSENEPTTTFTNHGAIVGLGFQLFLRGKKK